MTDMIEIDHRKLNPDTFDNLLAEIVSRAGTDYGEVECSTEKKISQLKSALISGEARIMFDATSGDCNIIQAPL